jgi:SAM-dependent methyltransferase
LGISGQFEMVRCIECGLHYLNPQPSMAELQRYYPEDYDPFDTPQPGQASSLRQLGVEYGLKKRCRAVTRYKTGGSLLEIGCSNGLFLDAMRRSGNWQVQGVDVTDSAVRQARELLALDVFHGTLEDAQFPSQCFDAVVMWDVLEHVHNPKETLLEIRRVLRPDGLFVCRVPLLGSWDHRLFQAYWAGWDAPRHLTVFSRDTLRLMLAKAGLRVERMTSISGSYPAFVLSVRFWAQEHLSARAQRRVRQILEALPARVIAAPYFWTIDRLGRSTTVTCVARPTSIDAR